MAGQSPSLEMRRLRRLRDRSLPRRLWKSGLEVCGSLTFQRSAVIEPAVIKGDTVREVLNYLQFFIRRAGEPFAAYVETALREGRLGTRNRGGC